MYKALCLVFNTAEIIMMMILLIIMELLCDLTNLLLDIYLKELQLIYEKDTCIFIAALFANANKWNRIRYSPIDVWKKKM
jgi:hypothetical protein